ncbi:hypothetical protein ACFSX9_08555 [Flavobacterium ardleyense]|uniref:Uncharacterized protein n=1 Tax=Flavobacterium ardleyense TaxID=2038737 RepID=A0ABW5Z8I7_9FLAO
MNKILIGLLVIVLGFVVFGNFLSNDQDGGAKWIGIGILILTFVVMPLFLYSRFRNKATRDRMFNFDLKKIKEPENQ